MSYTFFLLISKLITYRHSKKLRQTFRQTLVVMTKVYCSVYSANIVILFKQNNNISIQKRASHDAPFKNFNKECYRKIFSAKTPARVYQQTFRSCSANITSIYLRYINNDV